MVRVAGARLVDGNNNTIRLLGVNYDGAQDACWQGGGSGYFYGPSDSASVQAMVAWHINAVRLPVNEDCWLGINNVGNSPYFGSNYQNAIGNYIDLLHSFGIYAIIDLQENAPGTIQADDFQVLPDADHAPAFWKSVATFFLSKGDQGVLFDLLNEPHLGSSAPSTSDWNCWQNGCTLNQVSSGGGNLNHQWQTAGMQSLIDAVRSTGSPQPILLGGMSWDSEFGQFLSHMPTDSGHALVPTVHVYDWFGAATGSTSGWIAQIQPLLNAGLPVITGELGENDCAHGTIDGYMAWADSLGISYLGWAWNPNSCSAYPALISDFNGTPTNFGVGLKNHLAAIAGSTPLSAGAQATPTAGGPPLLVNFTGSAAGGTPPYSFSWNFGDGSSPSTALSPSHTYTSPGNYAATLTVKDVGGRTATAAAPPISVSALPLDVSAGANITTGDTPLAVAFTGSASGGTGPYTFGWTFGDGVTSNIQNPSHTYATAGQYLARLTLTDSANATASSNVITITANRTPTVVAAASPATGNAPLLVSLHATATDGTPPLSYQWTFGDGGSSGNQNPSHVYSAAGSYNPTVTVTDGSGNSATSSISVLVNASVSASASSSVTVGDVPLVVILSGSGSGGTQPYSYSWDFGDGSPTSSTRSPSHTYTSVGSYQAVLTISDSAGGNAKAAAITITVNSLPTVTASATPSSGDAPLLVAMKTTPNGGTQPYSYSWDFGDGSPPSSSQNPGHTYAAGTFNAKVTVTDAAGLQATALTPVTVAPLLLVTAAATPNSGSAPLTVSFVASAVGGVGPYSYTWDLGDGATSTSPSLTHAFGSAGNRSVRVTVADTTGRSTSAELLVQVTSPTSTQGAAIIPTINQGGPPASPPTGDAPVTSSGRSVKAPTETLPTPATAGETREHAAGATGPLLPWIVGAALLFALLLGLGGLLRVRGRLPAPLPRR